MAISVVPEVNLQNVPARTTWYLRVLMSCPLLVILSTLLFCSTTGLLGVKGISTIQFGQRNCSASHLPW